MFYPGGGYPGSYAPPTGGGVLYPVAPGEVIDFTASMLRVEARNVDLSRSCDEAASMSRAFHDDAAVDRQFDENLSVGVVLEFEREVER